jgi:hypothetical protein
MATGKKDGGREAELEAAIRSDPEGCLENRADAAEPSARHRVDPARTETRMTMRKVLAFVMVVCGTASADAAEAVKWCDEDGKIVVQLSPTTFVIDGRIVEQTHVLNGQTIEGVTTQRDDRTDKKMLVYRDRAFFPCLGAAGTDAAEAQKWCREDKGQIIVQLNQTTFIIDGLTVKETHVVNEQIVEGVDIEHNDGTDEMMLVYRKRAFFPCD